ncbi:hypothetical protein BGZ58_004352, partial [Dissophora ornata]
MSEIEYKEAFALFDPTNSGVIQPKAFADFLAAKVDSRDLLNDPELTKNVKLPSQALDYKSFAALMDKNHKGSETSEEAYGALFKSINKDGSGNADVDEIVHEADVSGDGRITLEEFLKIMQKSEKKLRGEHV